MPAIMERFEATGLPAWIVASPLYGILPLGHQHMLHVICQACRQSLPDGSRVGAEGGSALLAAARVSRSTWKRYLRVLEEAGFVVLLELGGCHYGENHPSVYGVPGHRGALEERRHRRSMHVVRQVEGRRVQQVIRPGGQVPLFVDGGPDWTPMGVQDEPPRGATVNPLHEHEHECEQHHEFMNGASRAEASGPHRGRWFSGRLTAGDLADDARLLALYRQAVAAGRLADSDFCRQEFVAAAEHALRVGTNPPGLFLRQVQELAKERGQRQLFTCEADDEAAAVRLRRIRGETPAVGTTPAISAAAGRPAAATRGRSPLSEDAHKAGVIRRMAAEAGVDPWHFGRAHLAGWDRARWDRAVAELECSRRGAEGAEGT